MINKRKIISVINLILFISLLFSCSQQQGRISSSPSEKVTIAFALLPDTALDQIAAANNYYEQEGLVVTRQSHQIGKQALQSVLDGKADFATVAETPFILSIMAGDKISAIATIDTSRKNMAVVAKKESGITKFEDLKGKKIATTFGTIGEFFMDSILIMNGISPKDIKAVNLPPERLIAALQDNEVDAISIWNPLLINIQKKLGDKGITFYGEEFYKQFFVVVAKQDYIQSHPEAVRKTLRALIRAEEFANRHPAEAQNIVAETSKTDKALLSDIWANNDFRADLGQSLILAMENESRWAIKNGLTKSIKIPNYLDNMYLNGLKAIKPEAVRIIR